MSDTIGVETSGEPHELSPPPPELRRLDAVVGLSGRTPQQSPRQLGPAKDGVEAASTEANEPTWLRAEPGE
jgi:hypothetical protein